MLVDIRGDQAAAAANTPALVIQARIALPPIRGNGKCVTATSALGLH
jgi:hypothetical protein